MIQIKIIALEFRFSGSGTKKTSSRTKEQLTNNHQNSPTRIFYSHANYCLLVWLSVTKDLREATTKKSTKRAQRFLHDKSFYETHLQKENNYHL